MTGPFAPLAKLAKPVNHIDALKSLMDRRAFAVLAQDERDRLDSVIATYQRLYVGPA